MALIAAFLPMSGEQVATILDVVAVLTGEQVVRKVQEVAHLLELVGHAFQIARPVSRMDETVIQNLATSTKSR